MPELPVETADEHLQWCKDRALAYLDRGDVTNALASFVSDMSKHEGTREHSGLQLLGMLLLGGQLHTADKVRDHITGYH